MINYICDKCGKVMVTKEPDYTLMLTPSEFLRYSDMRTGDYFYLCDDCVEKFYRWLESETKC